jgi:NAD+ synthase
MSLHPDILTISPSDEIKKISSFLHEQVHKRFRRKGIIVGLSGGVDSAVMAALAVHALGKENVIGLILPEKESNPLSAQYALNHAEKLGIVFFQKDISATVEAVGGYATRDEYLKSLVPEYTPACRYNIVLPTDFLDRDSLGIYTLQVQRPDGSLTTKRLNVESFRFITAFASIKIRARMIHLYWEAERRNLVVAGTTNKTEMMLGDFCKYGDGGTDIEAIAHLYKNQIYQLAHHLNVIPEIINRDPSPDTFSLPVHDQQFFFRIPFDKLDLLLYSWEHGIASAEAAGVIGISEEAVQRAFRDFTVKHNATDHLREAAKSLG